MLKRGDNQGDYKALVVAVAAQDEMNAMEQLGRKTRMALCNAPMKFAAVSILSDLQSAGYDPKDPIIDGFIARGVQVEGLKTLMRDRSPEDANLGITMMVPKKHGVTDLRVLRSERAAERRSRRFMRRR